MRRWWIFILLGIGWRRAAGVEAGQVGAAIDFVRDVKPIFESTCYECHGAEKQKGGLRLDSRSAAMRGGKTGKSIVPGDVKHSLLVSRVMGEGDDERMPAKKDPLSEKQIAVLAAWIEQGAHWPDSAAGPEVESAVHWAYVRPTMPALPKIGNANWAKNGIDYFVAARLEKEGLTPSGEAATETLIRRVTLDLTGLPPTPAEVAAFVADASPGAFEHVVDRLLASPAYGERWARPWLDLARYADSNGYEKDDRRSIWKYRDWVINALNADMPFDQFTIEQIAGDMLPNATMDQKVATGFHRNTMLNEEGGVDKDEARWLTLVDRVNTTASVWLGSTMACAQCHNHKFDPFTVKDYYSFLAFWESAAEPQLKFGKEKDAVSTLVMEEKPSKSPPKTFVRIRGSFLSKGEEVQANTPGFLAGLGKGEPQNRLGLAKWLVSKENPLTARVTVNRIWESYFGRGIVETTEDFGAQGDRPTHPDLLDYLAMEFMNHGWSQKALHRLIVTSATYRQSSAVNGKLLEKDPYNRLYARGPRFRLEAEMIRDNALAVSGLLSQKVGGPSVMPYQPEGIWNLPYNGDKWVNAKNEDGHRRGLYTFWRRTAPYPSFMTLDASSREYCTVRRVRTNTPLQALNLMNDPAFFEAARAMALRVMKEGPADEAGRVAYAFKLVVARGPSAGESARLLELLKQQQGQFAKDAGSAKAVAGVEKADEKTTDQAAWTMVCNVLLNLDETMTKE